MKIVNLTPHEITAAGQAIPASGQIARVSVTRQPAGKINGIPIFAPVFGDIDGLPPSQPETVYVVSAMVRTHPQCANRDDVFSPGALIRDAAGSIIGCDGLDGNPQAKGHAL